MRDDGHNDPSCDWSAGTNKKSLEKYTRQIRGNTKISELQKIALLGTSRIILVLGPRNGLCYCVVNWHKVIGDSR